jgi:hypothetical protein
MFEYKKRSTTSKKKYKPYLSNNKSRNMNNSSISVAKLNLEDTPKANEPYFHLPKGGDYLTNRVRNGDEVSLNSNYGNRLPERLLILIAKE